MSLFSPITPWSKAENNQDITPIAMGNNWEHMGSDSMDFIMAENMHN